MNDTQMQILYSIQERNTNEEFLTMVEQYCGDLPDFKKTLKELEESGIIRFKIDGDSNLEVVEVISSEWVV